MTDGDLPRTEADAIPQTAYMGRGASTYDAVRFTSRQGLAFDQLEREQLLHVVATIPRRANVLEVGCGTARFAKQLATMGHDVVGTDASPDMLALAREKCDGLNNIQFRLAESAHLELAPNHFDLVFAIRVLNSLESTAYALQTVREMIRVAKPGGRILLEFANARRPFAKQNNSVRLSFAELRRLAAAEGCEVTRQSGVLVLSQTLLNAMPAVVLPLWMAIERLLASALWGWASRGYLVLRKERAS